MANRNPGNSGWNMESIASRGQEGVDVKDWDPSDPNKKKLKPSRKFSFDQLSNKR